jgi:hypothetical protein
MVDVGYSMFDIQHPASSIDWAFAYAAARKGIIDDD